MGWFHACGCRALPRFPGANENPLRAMDCSIAGGCLPSMPGRIKLNLWSRKLHRWGAIAIALPALLVIATGVILQVKKQSAWVQPPAQRGSAEIPTLPFSRMLEIARSVPEAGISSWDDIDRLDVRPGKGMLKLRAKNRWEIQLDTDTGEILQVAYRRSDLIESLHDGSWFHEFAKLWVFLPNGLILLGLWFTGVYLWGLPIYKRWRSRRRAAR